MRKESYIDWATLLRRTYDLEMLKCPKCEGRMEPIAVIRERATAERILLHLGLDARGVLVGEGHTMAYDISGEPLVDWEDDTWQRGPPN
jgi:uncharacterized protein YbaR (Trm112 family)